jgi:DNA-binding NtrC family response regulator
LDALARDFLGKFASNKTLSQSALNILRQHKWPGNVRELRNAVERATILAEDENEVTHEHVIL